MQGRKKNGTFEPQLIPKHQTRWSGFDDKILVLYARGMTVREIQAHLEELYGTEVSPSLISSITDAVSEEVRVMLDLLVKEFVHAPWCQSHQN